MPTGNPVRVFLGWYEALPPELRAEIVMHLGVLCPRGIFDDLLEADPAALADKFPDRLRKLASSRPKSAGVVLVVAGVLDPLIARRDSKADWAEAKGKRAEIADYARAEGKESLAALLESGPADLYSRQWIRAGEAWVALRSDALSGASVMEWAMRRLSDVDDRP